MKQWRRPAEELPLGGRYCHCCGKDLSGKTIRMLELDQRDGSYHDRGDVPPDQSQGWFPFGLSCARKISAAHTDTKEG